MSDRFRGKMTEQKKPVKVKEITVALSGVIPTASYENLKPSFSMTVEPNGTPVDECFQTARKYIHNLFELEVNKARADLIEKQYQTIRFRERNGRKYPSVTSITSWDKDWRISEDELRQYAARGTIVHAILEKKIKEGVWVNPEDMPELKEEIIVLKTGSLGLSWTDCSYREAFEAIEGDVKVVSVEKKVFNDEHLYSGRYDVLGEYKGKLSILDFKTGSYEMKQLAAYAVCEEGVSQLVVVPVGPTKNKSGYKKPDVTEAVQTNFKAFLKDRAKFRQRFGI